MKYAFISLLLMFNSFCGSSQNISGSWSWQAENGNSMMEINLDAEGEDYIGYHCSVFQNGDRIDCVDEDKSASVYVKRTAENVFEGTIRSGYSASEGKIKLEYNPEEQILLFKILKAPEGIFYLPENATLSSMSNKLNTISEDSISINGKINYSTTSDQMFEVLGKPTKAQEVFWEMSEEKVLKYSYPGAEFFFADDKLESFKISSSNWSLEIPMLNLKIGDNINVLSRPYPEAFSQRENGSLLIPLGTGDYQFLLIEFNSKNEITVIDHRFF